MLLTGAVLRVPDDDRVAGTDVVTGHRTDEDRRAELCGDILDLVVGLLVAVRVDVGGVLRPDDQVRLGTLPGGDLVGELLGDPDVVVEHRLTLRVEVQAQPGHIALDRGDVEGGAVVTVRTGRPHR